MTNTERKEDLFDLYNRGVIKIPKLSILIATTTERHEMYVMLHANLVSQIRRHNLVNEVEILSLVDNKEMSIGNKRQELLKMAKGDFIVFFDDDDLPSPNYVKMIHDAIVSDQYIDCIGMNVTMTTNGKNPQKCCHSLKYPDWENNKDGWDYVRNITHFNPVLRKKALEIGFKDIRFGEDKEYSDRISKILENEYYIEEPLFHYRYSNKQSHNEKYGIK